MYYSTAQHNSRFCGNNVLSYLPAEIVYSYSYCYTNQNRIIILMRFIFEAVYRFIYSLDFGGILEWRPYMS